MSPQTRHRHCQEICAATEDKPLSCLLEIEADSKIVSNPTYVNYTLNSCLLYLAVKNTATTGVSLKCKADERFAMTAEHASSLYPQTLMQRNRGQPTLYALCT